MFTWLSAKTEDRREVYTNVAEGMKLVYKHNLLPLEQHFLFHDFHRPPLDDGDFESKPLILLVGEYSTGKTTFIKYLLERDFPGMRIGPEPTTDRFIAVMYDEKEGMIPGNAAVVDSKKHFAPLSSFGNAFLNRFQISFVKSPVLKGMSIIDTPGILSGEQQRIDRGYDFSGVLEWFAGRADRIILMFDAYKLHISDEFRRCIMALRGHDDKIRIVLSKADMLNHQELMRVYGALMWSLGQLLETPEAVRVYIGSFWNEPSRSSDVNRRLFDDEARDLFKDLQGLPRNSAMRKLNDLMKRARLARVHAYIISELKKEMPVFGKESKKKDLIGHLQQIYQRIESERNIPSGDFPKIEKMQGLLSKFDFTKFHSWKPKLLEALDDMDKEISSLMSIISTDTYAEVNVKDGIFANIEPSDTPFGYKSCEGINAGFGEADWIVNRHRDNYDKIFDASCHEGDKMPGSVAKVHMLTSKLPNNVLSKIWRLADVDKDGHLDKDEFALAMYLIDLKLSDNEIPVELPTHLVPPSKRTAYKKT